MCRPHPLPRPSNLIPPLFTYLLCFSFPWKTPESAYFYVELYESNVMQHIRAQLNYDTHAWGLRGGQSSASWVSHQGVGLDDWTDLFVHLFALAPKVLDLQGAMEKRYQCSCSVVYLRSISARTGTFEEKREAVRFVEQLHRARHPPTYLREGTRASHFGASV